MCVLVTFKSKEDQMKNDGAGLVVLCSHILDAQGQLALYIVGGRMWPKIKLIQALWLSLLPAKMRNIHLKTKALEWSQQIFHCKSK